MSCTHLLRLLLQLELERAALAMQLVAVVLLGAQGVLEDTNLKQKKGASIRTNTSFYT